MKYWLIFFLFDSEGQFIQKREVPVVSAERCMIEAAKMSLVYVNRGYLTQSWCVTDDHRSGRSQDPGIPYD